MFQLTCPLFILTLFQIFTVASAGIGSGGGGGGSGGDDPPPSPGAIAGIMIGIAALLIVLGIGAGVYTTRRRKSAQQQQPRSQALQEAEDRRLRMLATSNGPLGWNAQRFPDGDPRRQRQRQQQQQGRELIRSQRELEVSGDRDFEMEATRLGGEELPRYEETV